MNKSPKAGDQFKVTSDLENNEKLVLLLAGNGQFSRNFPETMPSPEVPRHLELICLVNLCNFKGIQFSCRKGRSILVP